MCFSIFAEGAKDYRQLPEVICILSYQMAEILLKSLNLVVKKRNAEKTFPDRARVMERCVVEWVCQYHFEYH